MGCFTALDNKMWAPHNFTLHQTMIILLAVNKSSSHESLMSHKACSPNLVRAVDLQLLIVYVMFDIIQRSLKGVSYH